MDAVGICRLATLPVAIGVNSKSRGRNVASVMTERIATVISDLPNGRRLACGYDGEAIFR